MRFSHAKGHMSILYMCCITHILFYVEMKKYKRLLTNPSKQLNHLIHRSFKPSSSTQKGMLAVLKVKHCKKEPRASFLFLNNKRAEYLPSC
jgi:hypothetical protein